MGASVDPFGNALGSDILQNLAGKALNCVLVVVEVRGDWPAWCDFACIRTWGHDRFPCPLCNCDQGHLGDMSCASFDSVAWDLYSLTEHQANVKQQKMVPKMSS